jgi:NAD(P)H-hydrate repair Nnr-like enzyme with NAD(P)H-hydrate dehydratase domain
VLVVGGHADMGGAVIMSAEAAFHAGAGKVVVCHAKHHQAILARSPNIMVRDINALDQDDPNLINSN